MNPLARRILPLLALGALLSDVLRAAAPPVPPLDQALAATESGGCIEGAVIGEARAAIADGRPRRLEFGVSDEDAWAVGLACGGRVEVYVERVE